MGSKTTFDLNFNHPVKELIFVNDVNWIFRTDNTSSFGPFRTNVRCIT